MALFMGPSLPVFGLFWYIGREIGKGEVQVR